MRLRFAIIPAIFVLLAMVIAVPADAKKPFRGWMDLYFNSGFAQEEPVTTPCPQITWVGNIVFDGVEYGITFEPLDSRETGGAFHFEEIWRIHETAFDFTGGEFTLCNDEDAPVEMWGYDVGVGPPPDVAPATANGTVEEVPGDIFDENLTGRRVHWSGTAGMDGLEPTFSGPFRIN